jgi:hypothetical protein
MRRTSRKPVFLVQFHPFGAPFVKWAVILRATDAYDAIHQVRRRFGNNQSCCVMRFQ